MPGGAPDLDVELLATVTVLGHQRTALRHGQVLVDQSRAVGRSVSGLLPPALATLGLVPVSAENGRVVFSLTPQEWHQNPLGTLHGGILAGLLDTATGCAVHSTLDAGTLYTTVDLSVTFLRPVATTHGELRCEGHVVSRGRRTAFARAEVRDDRDRLAAHATSTCLLLPGDEHWG